MIATSAVRFAHGRSSSAACQLLGSFIAILLIS
jgi:hypothetical protein